MRGSTSSAADDHKRHFLSVFRRWEALFKRADRGDIQAEKWLIAEYFASLGHLNEHGLTLLTGELKKRCTFFPTIRECLEIINVPQISANYASPFYRPRLPVTFQQEALAAPAQVAALPREQRRLS